MKESAIDEPPILSTSTKDQEDPPTTDVVLSTNAQQNEPEPIAITLNPKAVCFKVSSQDYNVWPALPTGGPITGTKAEGMTPTHEDDKQNTEAIFNFQSNTPSDGTTQKSENALVLQCLNDELNQENPSGGEGLQECSPQEGFDTRSTDHPRINSDNSQQQPPSDESTNNSPISFNLYQRQANIYSEANLHQYPALLHAHHSAPAIQPPMELQEQIYFNFGHGPSGAETNYPPPSSGIQMMPMPNFLPPPPLHFQNQNEGMYSHHHYPQVPLPLPHQLQQMDGHHQDNHQPFQTFNVIVPQPVYYGFPDPDKNDTDQHHTCCGGECTSSGQCQCQIEMAAPSKEENLLQIKIPSWAKLNLDEEENTCLHPLSTSSRSSSRPRLVEYVGDQYHEKNPHTRRTILLNQRRSSDNDPIVFYRFYQFSCSCLGKVWFSPLHRAREGCYCRDCHKFVKPFGHIDGLTPYMGHELCYAKFQCHHCGRSWSCQKSRSNFPDNCFSCGSIVYPYYQVSHSVLRRKIVRQNDNGTIRFRNWTYSGSSSTSLEDDEEYQEIFGQGPLYFEQRRTEGSPPSQDGSPTEIGSNKTSSSDGGASARSASASNICLDTDQHSQNQSLYGGNPLLGQSISDTAIVLGHPRSEALHSLIGGGHGRIGLRHHLHRK